MQPHVSIIIPTYNRSDLLRDAVDSCYRSALGLIVEIIVVDDASAEDIPAALKGFDVLYIRLDVNSGSAVARNRGKLIASGKYVKFLDSDDVLNDGALLEEYMEAQRTGADIVLSGWQDVHLAEDKSMLFADVHRAPIFTTSIIDDLLQGKAVPTSSALYKNQLATIVDWDPQLTKLNDWDFFISAALETVNIVSIPRVAYLWRHHSGERITSSSSFLHNAKEFFRILEKLEVSLNVRGEMNLQRKQRLAQYLYKELRGAYRFDPPLGNRMLRKIVALDPNFKPLDEERSLIFRHLCRMFPIHPVLAFYGAARRTCDRLKVLLASR